jgi:hypothetical protein
MSAVRSILGRNADVAGYGRNRRSRPKTVISELLDAGFILAVLTITMPATADEVIE